MTTRKPRAPGRKTSTRKSKRTITKRTTMKVSRQESERREKAAYKFFEDSLEASVEDLNKAFKAGKLHPDGKSEPTLNIKKAYALRKKARADNANKMPSAKAARRIESVATPLTGEEQPLPFSEAAVRALRTVTAELPSTNLEGVTVRRDGSLVLLERSVTERRVSLTSA